MLIYCTRASTTSVGASIHHWMKCVELHGKHSRPKSSYWCMSTQKNVRAFIAMDNFPYCRLASIESISIQIFDILDHYSECKDFSSFFSFFDQSFWRFKIENILFFFGFFLHSLVDVNNDHELHPEEGFQLYNTCFNNAEHNSYWNCLQIVDYKSIQ